MRPTFRTSLSKILIVGLLFYGTYGFANWCTAQRSNIPEIAFAWEKSIPFWAWTIVPYWSLNFFYALAFFVCSNVRQQNRYITQLLVAQAVAVACFLLFPLQFTWEKPQTSRLFAYLFDSLAAFDLPYNQAPSLHIMLVLIVGRFYWYKLPAHWRIVWASWFCLIALSVLTTWQHHFIDIPTGLLAGALVLWALPWQKNEMLASPVLECRQFPQRHYWWVGVYCLISLVFGVLSVFGGAWLYLLWPAVSCLVVAAAYAFWGAVTMQKQQSGKHTLAAILLLWPYRLGAYLNMRFWLCGQALSTEVVQGKVHIGSIRASGNFQAVLDVCAELPLKKLPKYYISLPMLDMVPPSADELAQAADMLQALIEKKKGPVLTCCALGYGRSTAVVLTWLLRHGGFVDFEHALAMLKQKRPKIILHKGTEEAVLAAVKLNTIPVDAVGRM